MLQEYPDFSTKYDVPLWLGESGENTDEWIAAFRELLESNGISWCFWLYKKLDATSCMASIARTPEWEAIVEFAEHPRTTFEEVRNCRINQGYLTALGLT